MSLLDSMRRYLMGYGASENLQKGILERLQDIEMKHSQLQQQSEYVRKWGNSKAEEVTNLENENAALRQRVDAYKADNKELRQMLMTACSSADVAEILGPREDIAIELKEKSDEIERLKRRLKTLGHEHDRLCKSLNRRRKRDKTQRDLIDSLRRLIFPEIKPIIARSEEKAELFEVALDLFIRQGLKEAPGDFAAVKQTILTMAGRNIKAEKDLNVTSTDDRA